MTSSSPHPLRAHRLDAGLSQRQLASMADVSQAAIHGIETGRHGATDALKVRLARALGVSAYELFPLDELAAS